PAASEEPPAAEPGAAEGENASGAAPAGEGEGEGEGEAPPARSAPAPDATPAAPSSPLPWEQLVTVTGAPGQVYVLQHFEQRDVYRFSRSGLHWVSSVHAGAAEDSVDATAVVTDRPPNAKERYLTAAAIPLDLHTAWGRRF